MGNNRPLFWGQGQFLLPQHFQQQDLFHQNQRHQGWRLARPFGWGVLELRLREDGLAANMFDVLALRAVTRDGALIEAGSELASPNAIIRPRSFEGQLEAGAMRPLSVHLALPRYRTRESNLGDDEGGQGAGRPPRFHLATRAVADLFDPAEEPGEIAFLDYNLKIVFDRDDSFAQAVQHYDMIKLAELVPAPDGSGAVLVDDYIPPCLSLDASPTLRRLLQTVRDLLLSRAQGDEFAVVKGRRPSGSQELGRLVVLQTLNRWVPVLQHHLEVSSLHPFESYALLRSLIGELSTFSEAVDVLGGTVGDPETRLSAYNHDDLRGCFQPAVRTVRRLMEELGAGPEHAVRLEFDGEYFAAAVPRDFFEGAYNRYYLVIESSLSGKDLVALLQQTGKISTRANMPQLRRAALFGLRIDYLPAPPEELPQRGGRLSYFAIDTQSQHWAAIKNAGDIAVLGQLDPNDTTIKLIVVRPEG